MLKFSIGFFIVMLIGVGASSGSKKPATLKPGASTRANPAALIGKSKSDDDLTNSLAAPAGKPTQQLQVLNRSVASSRNADAGFPGHSDKPATSSNKDQGFPGFAK